MSTSSQWPKSGVPWDAQEREQLERMYREYVPWEEISRVLTRSVESCRLQVRRMGLRRPRHPSSFARQPINPWTDDEKKRAVALYREGRTLQQIGSLLKRDKSRVSAVLRACGVKMRPLGSLKADGTIHPWRVWHGGERKST